MKAEISDNLIISKMVCSVRVNRQEILENQPRMMMLLDIVVKESRDFM
jgi:hypothetical protein